jgi:hypothetical protein
MSNDNASIGVDDQKAIKEGESAKFSKFEQEEDKTARDFKGSKGDKLTMSVKVYSPFKEYYDGDAFSISAENLTGAFDVLPKHHSFISLLSPCELVIRTPNDKTKGAIKIRITGGLIHIKADQVIVFLDV